MPAKDYVFDGPLSLVATQFMKVLKRFEGEMIAQRTYALMFGVSVRCIQFIFQELRIKGYIKTEIAPTSVWGDNRTLYKTKVTIIKFPDGFTNNRNADFAIADDIVKRLSTDQTKMI